MPERRSRPHAGVALSRALPARVLDDRVEAAV
jgi:hypothetical protein